jgi:hypothetical protein
MSSLNQLTYKKHDSVTVAELGSVVNEELDYLRGKINDDVEGWTNMRFRFGTEALGVPSVISAWNLQKTMETAFGETVKQVEAMPGKLGHADGKGLHLQLESVIVGQGEMDRGYGMMLSVTSVIDGTVRDLARDGMRVCTDGLQILNPFLSPSKTIKTWIKPDTEEPGRWRSEIDGDVV